MFTRPLRRVLGLGTLRTPRHEGAEDRSRCSGTVDRTGLTGLAFELSCKAAVETAANGRVGHHEVVDVVVGSREAVEPSRADIEESRRRSEWVARATYRVCWMLFDNRVEIIGCARRTL